MENKTKRLNILDLESLSGGNWDSRTLTNDEYRRLDTLYSRWYEAPKRSAEESEAESAFYAFIDEMEQKYGPSGKSREDWLRGN